MATFGCFSPGICKTYHAARQHEIRVFNRSNSQRTYSQIFVKCIYENHTIPPQTPSLPPQAPSLPPLPPPRVLLPLLPTVSVQLNAPNCCPCCSRGARRVLLDEISLDGLTADGEPNLLPTPGSRKQNRLSVPLTEHEWMI